MPFLSPRNEDEIRALSAQDLAVYLRARLSGQVTPPLLDSRTSEEPQTVLVRAYTSSDVSFRSKLDNVLRLCCWEAENADPEPTFFSRVLDLVETLKIGAATPHLVCLLTQDRPFFREVSDLYKTDLRLHIMSALLATHTGPDPINWQEFIPNPLYAATAFVGLLRQNEDKAIAQFPGLVRLAWQHPQVISLRKILLHLVHRLPKEVVVLKVFTVARVHLNEHLRALVFEQVRSIRSVAEVAQELQDILGLHQVAAVPVVAEEPDLLEQVVRFVNPRFSSHLCTA